MRSDIALAVGEALYPMLSGLQELGQQRLRAVRQIEVDSCLDRLIFDFETLSLAVSAVAGDDSIDFESLETGKVDDAGAADVSGLHLWKSFIDASFGWGWATVNQQGYCDGLLLSFGGIVPQVAVNVMASSLRCGRIAETSWHPAFVKRIPRPPMNADEPHMTGHPQE